MFLVMWLVAMAGASDGPVEVSRDQVAAIERGEVTGLGRAILHRGPDGAFDGVRLYSLAEGSFLVDLGFESGDIVHAINGLPLDSVQAVALTIEALREAPQLTINITRRGGSMVRIIQFRD